METTLVDSIKSATVSMKEFERGVAQAAKATEGLNEPLRELKARQRRRFYRIAVYTMIALMAITIWFLEISTGCKVGIDLALLITTWLIWGFDHTKEIDQDLLLSPNELIMKKKLEERENGA